jgi:hypothetical protein
MSTVVESERRHPLSPRQALDIPLFPILLPSSIQPLVVLATTPTDDPFHSTKGFQRRLPLTWQRLVSVAVRSLTPLPLSRLRATCFTRLHSRAHTITRSRDDGKLARIYIHIQPHSSWILGSLLMLPNFPDIGSQEPLLVGVVSGTYSSVRSIVAFRGLVSMLSSLPLPTGPRLEFQPTYHLRSRGITVKDSLEGTSRLFPLRPLPPCQASQQENEARLRVGPHFGEAQANLSSSKSALQRKNWCNVVVAGINGKLRTFESQSLRRFDDEQLTLLECMQCSLNISQNMNLPA